MGKTNLKDVHDLSKLSPEDIDSISESIGKDLADRYRGIKTNQVRNIFSSVMALRSNLKANRDKGFTDELHNELVLLKPKLAYAVGRNKNVKPLYELLSDGISATVNSSDKLQSLKNFIQLVESIVAYHKFFGGN